MATPSRRCAAREPASSASVFRAFRQSDRVRPLHDVPPAASTSRRDGLRRTVRIVEDPCFSAPSSLSRAEKSRDFARFGKCLQPVADCVRQFSSVDEELRPA